MARETAPTSQWAEPRPASVAGSVARYYPVLEDGVWGWTRRASEADGIVVLEDGVLGVDDSTTVGGLRAFGLGGIGPLFAIGA